ncbi:hypothetical protein ACQ86N_05370 [Puia sp. P3]
METVNDPGKGAHATAGRGICARLKLVVWKVVVVGRLNVSRMG